MSEEHGERSERLERLLSSLDPDGGDTDYYSSDEGSPDAENYFSNGIDVCDRCRSIPWGALWDFPRDSRIFMPEIRKSAEVLWSSRCRICQFFAVVNLEQEPRNRHEDRAGVNRIDTRHAEENTFHGSSVQEGNIQAELLYDPRYCRRQFGITDRLSEDKIPDRRYYQTRQISVDQVKGWIKDCETHHSHDYVMASSIQETLCNFRVIDCESLLVVSAPPRCQYVALSYVWGRHVTVH
jgi:hypothetical protein